MCVQPLPTDVLLVRGLADVCPGLCCVLEPAAGRAGLAFCSLRFPAVAPPLRVLYSCFLVLAVVALISLAAGRLLLVTHSGRCPCMPWSPLAAVSNIPHHPAAGSGSVLVGARGTTVGRALLLSVECLAGLGSVDVVGVVFCSPLTQVHPYGLGSARWYTSGD